MSKVRKTAIFLLLFVTVVGLSGCTTFDNFKAAFIDKPQKQELTIQIGVLEPVTGVDSKAAEEEIRGIQLANEVHPSVNGKMVSLVFSDNKSDIDATETAVQTLIAKEPLVILGSYGNVYSLAASPYINKAKIPAITMTNTNPLITKNNSYYYRVCDVDSNQGDLLARYILENKSTTKDTTADGSGTDGKMTVSAGVIIPEGDDASMAVATAFSDRIKAETEDDDAIVLYETYKAGQEDFTGILNKIEKTGVENVLVAGEYKDAANIISEASKKGLNTNFLGDTSWGNGNFRKQLDSSVSEDNVMFIQFFASEGAVSGEGVTKERKAFLEAYAKKYGTDSNPTDSMALGYDAYFVAIDAIDKAPDNADSEQVAAILKNPHYSFEGASGSISFGTTGDPIKPAYISKWQGEKIVTVATIEALK